MTKGLSEDVTPVLVLGSGVTALGVVRALGRLHVPLFVLSAHPGVEKRSRWYRKAPGDLSGKSLEEYLTESSMKRAVLLPCSDNLTVAVAELPIDLQERFPASVPRVELVGALVDKAQFADLLDAHDVPHPRTRTINDSSDLAGWGDDLERAFIKPRDSQRFFARYGVKALRPSGREEITKSLEQVSEDGFEVVIQEYIPGPAHNHYFIDGFVDRDGNVTAVFARRRLRMYPPWFGNSSAVETVSRGEVAQAEHDLLKLLGAVNYRGIFSAEFKRDARDDSFRLLEINPRAWWYLEFAVRCGVDVVAMAYRDALGLKVNSVDDYPVGRTLVYPYYDFQACREEWRKGELKVGSVLRSWVGADHAVFAFDDWWPFLADLLGLCWSFVARRVRPSRSAS